LGRRTTKKEKKTLLYSALMEKQPKSSHITHSDEPSDMFKR
jgi:hypothetical protein